MKTTKHFIFELMVHFAISLTLHILFPGLGGLFYALVEIFISYVTEEILS